MPMIRDGQDELQSPLAETHHLSWSQRLGMLVFNYISVLLVAVILCALLIPSWNNPGWRVLAAALILYLAPPLLARLVLAAAPIRQGVISVGSTDFFKWWAVFNLQVIFCRFPMLEELLRIVPGAYSAWLRLWGASIGRLTYWAAGTRILDRSFIRIGDDVVFGAGVRINPHVMTRNDRGHMELLLADVVIGDRALIGGYSLLTTGTVIDPDDNTRACQMSPPFSQWKNGRRVRTDNGDTPLESRPDQKVRTHAAGDCGTSP